MTLSARDGARAARESLLSPMISRAARRLLSTPASLRLLPALDAGTSKQLTVKVPSDDGLQMRLLEIFIVRDGDGKLAAYENCCPHAGGPLNQINDRFFDRNGLLLCTRHGARFDPSDGFCIKGPCAGDALNDLEVHAEADGSVHATMSELKKLCRLGGGAYTTKTADEAADLAWVQRPDDDSQSSSTAAASIDAMPRASSRRRARREVAR